MSCLEYKEYMKIGDIVRIKTEKEINKECDCSPGWDKDMSQYCGGEYEVEEKLFISGRLYLKNTNGWIWHECWLADKNSMSKFKDMDFDI